MTAHERKVHIYDEDHQGKADIKRDMYCDCKYFIDNGREGRKTDFPVILCGYQFGAER